MCIISLLSNQVEKGMKSGVSGWPANVASVFFLISRLGYFCKYVHVHVLTSLLWNKVDDKVGVF